MGVDPAAPAAPVSVLFARARRDAKTDMIPPRAGTVGRAVTVTAESAMRSSAVWACLRLRADLLSTLPLDVFRKVGGIQLELPAPQKLLEPGGPGCRKIEWLYSSQVDLDRYGNAFGVIESKDARNLPSVVTWAPAGSVTVRVDKDRVVTYWIDGKKYMADEIWHERQYTVTGLPVGLSPIAYAAMSISQGLSAQEWAIGWYDRGGAPGGHLRFDGEDKGPAWAETVKTRWRAATAGGDVFVSGKGWEFSPAQAATNDAAFLQAQQATIPDIARFMGCPADLIDAMVSGQSVTYANITQRNLQFLIMHLGPAIIRREDALSYGWLPRPQFIKLNSDALLRMDPKAVSEMLGQQVRDRLRAPSEARKLMNLQPYTDEQLAEFDRMFPGQNKTDLARALQQLYLSVGKVISPDEARTIANDLYGADLPVPGPVLTTGGSQ